MLFKNKIPDLPIPTLDSLKIVIQRNTDICSSVRDFFIEELSHGIPDPKDIKQ